MDERKSINKHHPGYPEYRKKCYDLRDYYTRLIDAEEERLKTERLNWMNCKDGLESPQKHQLQRQMYIELKVLQKEYSYLFTEEDQNDQNHQ